MIREYPPKLTGRPEAQIAQMRDYLVRLIRYLDEMETPAEAPDLSALAEWQTSVNNAIGSIRAAVRSAPLVQYGEAASGEVTFPTAYAGPPVVFAAGGTVSDVTAASFTLAATGTAQWIAVGRPRR
jgi:hypothetical protein